MGYADINGNARMVDMEGNVEEVNLKGMDFFERALQGEKSISNTFADQQDASGYINYFGVRINDGNGNARGVLCAVHSAVVLREIIDAPFLKEPVTPIFWMQTAIMCLRPLRHMRETSFLIIKRGLQRP